MAKIKLNGDTSGYIEISAPAVSGNNTLELGPGTKILTNLDNTFTGITTFSNGIHITSGGFILNQQRSDTHTSLIIDKPDAGTGTLKFFNNGSASAYIQHTGAEHLHYYLPSGSGYHALYTNGTERLRITSDGKMGLGTQTPDATLKVNVASGNNGVVVQNTSTANIALFGARNGDATVQIGQWGSTASGSTFGLSNADLSFIYTTSYSTTHPSALALGTVSNKPIVFATNNTERLRIGSDGNLSLGTTVSNERVNIHTASSLKAQVQFTNTTTGTGGGDGLVIGITGGEDSIFWNQENTNILFATNNAERVRITSAGKLGIGVQSPFSRLQSGGHTFNGGNGMHSNDRVGMSNHGNLTGLMLASTYNDGSHPEYGLVFVQGPNTSSYNVWGICPDGPAKGNSLNLHYGAQNTNIHSPSNRKFEFTGDGYLLKPSHPSFRAGRSSSYSPGAGSDIIFNTVSGGGKHNVGNHYNTTNGRFTAPVAGVYTFTVHVIWEGLTNGQNMADCFHPKINGTVVGYSGRRGEYIANETGNSGYYTDFMTYQFTLASGDYVTVNNQFSRTIHGNSNYTTFSGHLVG